MINWKIRIKNKIFWTSVVSVTLVIIERVLKVFGIGFDFGELGNTINAVIDGVFLLLGILGVVVDPTTAGIGDSSQALTYDKPKDY